MKCQTILLVREPGLIIIVSANPSGCWCDMTPTCLEAVDGEAGLSQEVLVTEHVNLIHHKAQEGKGRVTHGELERLPRPRGVQTIIR
jgi:hypothetical protein